MGKAQVLLNKPNSTKYFYPADDNWEMKLMPMKASTAFAEGAAIGVEVSSNVTTGNLTLMPATGATGGHFMGIMAEPVVAADSDYATAGKLKAIRIPKTNKARAYFAVWAGTLAATDVFSTVSFHSDSLGLACDTLGLWAKITEMLVAGAAGTGKGICEFSCPITLTA